jgi:hypothetical protein
MFGNIKKWIAAPDLEPRRGRRCLSYRPTLEALEDRQLLSGLIASRPLAGPGAQQGVHQDPQPAVHNYATFGTGVLQTSSTNLNAASGNVGVSQQALTAKGQTSAVTDSDIGLTSVFTLGAGANNGDIGLVTETWLRTHSSTGAVYLDSSDAAAVDSVQFVAENPYREVLKISAGTDVNGHPMVVVIFKDGTAWEYQDADASGALRPQGHGVWTWLQPGLPLSPGGGFTGTISGGSGDIIPLADLPQPPTPSIQIVDIAAGMNGEVAMVDANGNLHDIPGVVNGADRRSHDVFVGVPPEESGHKITQLSAALGNIDVLFDNHDAWAWSQYQLLGWFRLDSGVKAVAAGAWGVSDVLKTDGSLIQYYNPWFGWDQSPIPLATHVQSVSMSPDDSFPGGFNTYMVINGEAFEDHGRITYNPTTGANSVQQHILPFTDLGGSSGHDGAVQAIFASSGGSVILLFSDGVVKLHNPNFFADDVSL